VTAIKQTSVLCRSIRLGRMRTVRFVLASKSGEHTTVRAGEGHVHAIGFVS